MADMPAKHSLRNRFSSQLFRGASGGVLRGMAILALGSGGGQVIGIVAIPILTRLYTPEDFGVLAVFTALVGILAPLVTLRYVLALPLPRHDGVAMNLLALSTVMMVGLTVPIALSLWFWGVPLLALVSMQVLAPWWWLIAVGVLSTAVYEMLTMWATRRRAYRVIAQTNVTQSAVGAMVKIMLGMAGLQPLGLLLGQVVAQAGGIGRMLREFSDAFCTNWRHVTAIRLRKAAWRHRGFPIWRVPSQLFLVVAAQAPVLFVASLYDAYTVGQFGLAMLVLLLPINLLSQNTSKALYAETAVISHRPELIYEILKKTIISVLLISALISIGVLFFALTLFNFVVGDGWELSSSTLAILAPAAFIILPAASTSSLLNVIGGQHLYFGLNIFRALSIVAPFIYASISEVSYISLMVMYSASRAMFSLVNILWVFYIAKRNCQNNPSELT